MSQVDNGVVLALSEVLFDTAPIYSCPTTSHYP
jgi:hypothetical protein